MGSFKKPAILSVLACLSGAAVWFGVQAIAGRDNFGDQVNPLYFAILYFVAFLLGFLVSSHRSMAFKIGAVLVLTQIVCFLIYPNVDRKLGNLFPIAAGMLFFFVAPAVLVVYLGSRLRRTRAQEVDPA